MNKTYLLYWSYDQNTVVLALGIKPKSIIIWMHVNQSLCYRYTKVKLVRTEAPLISGSISIATVFIITLPECFAA